MLNQYILTQVKTSEACKKYGGAKKILALQDLDRVIYQIADEQDLSASQVRGALQRLSG